MSILARSKDKREVAVVETPLEQISRQSVAEAQQHEAQLQQLYEQLARCSRQIPETLQQDVDEQLESLRRTESSLKESLQKTKQMEDELSARLYDEKKSVHRKWYRLNPPANAAIDLQEKEKKHFARGMNLYKILLILFIGSFAGVVVELLWCYVTHGYFESRSGLVYGPFNMLYGVGAVTLSILLYRYRNRGKWLSLLGGMAIGSVVEYACSWWQEVTFGSRSWDYSGMPLNINGRICLLYSIFWGILGVMWIKDIYPRMAKWILRIPDKTGKIITWVVTIFLAINCLVSGAAVIRWSERKQALPANNAVRQVLDQRFPDERLERIYANMVFQ